MLIQLKIYTSICSSKLINCQHQMLAVSTAIYNFQVQLNLNQSCEAAMLNFFLLVFDLIGSHFPLGLLLRALNNTVQKGSVTRRFDRKLAPNFIKKSAKFYQKKSKSQGSQKGVICLIWPHCTKEWLTT